VLYLRGLIAAVTLIALVLLSAPAPSAAAGGDRDCADFSTQREAQQFFETHDPGSDPHQLDADDDGIACEDLPCPCDSGDGGGGGGGGGHPDLRRSAKILSVTDGDTIAVRVNGNHRDVRLIGLDAPEVSFEPECGGGQASASLGRLLDRGDRVILVRDPSQGNVDVYGRLLRYVQHHARDVGRRQIARGWAHVFVYRNPFRRIDGYRTAQRRARRHDRGVWGLCGGEF
jgi:endonuclease YncB( thermonuclease family)